MLAKGKGPAQQAQLRVKLFAAGGVLLLLCFLFASKKSSHPEVEATQFLGGVPQKHYLSTPRLKVAWFCSDRVAPKAARDAFLAHQKEWEKMGHENPWYSVLTFEELKDKNDKNIPQHLVDDFYASAQEWIDLSYRHHMKKNGLSYGGRALDFGCGLGRLTMELAKDFEHVTGVDQSAPHLAIAREQANLRGVGNVKFVQRDWNLLQGDLEPGKFDFVGSLIVLQHMVPPLMEGYIRQFCELLRPGGAMMFSIPTYIPWYKWECDIEKSISQGGMQMHALPQSVISDVLLEKGCKVVEFIEKDYIVIPGSQSTLVVAVKLD